MLGGVDAFAVTDVAAAAVVGVANVGVDDAVPAEDGALWDFGFHADDGDAGVQLVGLLDVGARLAVAADDAVAADIGPVLELLLSRDGVQDRAADHRAAPDVVVGHDERVVNLRALFYLAVREDDGPLDVAVDEARLGDDGVLDGSSEAYGQIDWIEIAP